MPVAPPGAFLFDPNPAVTRAGLVEDLARRLGAWKIDDRIAFLSTDTIRSTPFARTLQVVDSAPWNEKDFARRLRALGIGSADLRRRGLAGDVDQIRRRLKLSGPHRATLVLTRVADRPWGLICTDPAAPAVLISAPIRRRPPHHRPLRSRLRHPRNVHKTSGQRDPAAAFPLPYSAMTPRTGARPTGRWRSAPPGWPPPAWPSC